MQSIYYSVTGLVAILIHLIVNANYHRRVHKSREGREYKRYLSTIFIFYFVDATWGVFDTIGNVPLLYFDTIVHYLTLAFSVMFGCRYVIAFLNLQNMVGKVLNVLGWIFVLGVIPLLVVNCFVPIVFSFDSNGHYSSHILRYIVILLQVLMFASISVMSFIAVQKTEGNTHKRNITICWFGLIMTTALILQTIFPLHSFYALGLMMGTLIIHVFIYEEEKTKRFEEINELNCKLEERQHNLELSAVENAEQMQKITDLNKRLSIEKSNHESYLNIISNAGLGVWYIFMKKDTPSRMHANDKMKSLLGISGLQLTEEEVYNAWYSRIVESAIPSVQASVQEMLDGKFSENTYEWNHPEKGIIYVRCGGTAKLLPDGTYEITGYHSDVTDVVMKEKANEKMLKKARIEAEAANRAKTIFLNNMSHDIRTPMNAIMGFTYLMQKNNCDPSVLNDYLEKIQSSGEYLLNLINNVLDMASIESGNAVINEEFYDFSDENKSVLPLFQSLVMKKKLKMTNRMDVQHKYVFVDCVKMHEITANLLGNAIKYTPEGGSIDVELKEVPCEREGYGRYVLRVSDTGIGMSKDFADHMFDMFSREHTSTESKVVGSGLGMSIVKKLADLLGGTIEVETELGKGTTITFTMEHKIVQNPEEYLAQTLEEKNADFSFNGKRILLVEDNDLNAEIATVILEDAGIHVERADDGIKCIKMLTDAEAGYYDVILMDIQMPVLNGYETTMRIRQLSDAKKANIPILAMTANVFEDDVQKTIDAGMDGHLTKPIEVPLLMQTLSKILGRIR